MPAPPSPQSSSSRAAQQSSALDDSLNKQSASVRQIFSKSLVAGADWTDKDDLLDVLYWLRQILSAVIGVLWALVPLHGVLALLLYVAISTVVGHLYVTAYQRVDEDLVGGAWEIAKEGFGSAFATFMILWIVGYSALHFD